MFIIISPILILQYLRLIEKENVNENKDIDTDRIRTGRIDFRFSLRREPLFPDALPCHTAQIRRFEFGQVGEQTEMTAQEGEFHLFGGKVAVLALGFGVGMGYPPLLFCPDCRDHLPDQVVNHREALPFGYQFET